MSIASTLARTIRKDTHFTYPHMYMLHVPSKFLLGPLYIHIVDFPLATHGFYFPTIWLVSAYSTVLYLK